MLEHTTCQVKVLFLSRNAFIFPRSITAVCFLMKETGNEFRLRLPPVHYFERDWNSKQYGGNGG